MKIFSLRFFSPLTFVVRFLLYKSGQDLLNSLIISSHSDFDSVSHFIWSNSNPPLVWSTCCKTFETSRNHENLRVAIENLEIILPWEGLCILLMENFATWKSRLSWMNKIQNDHNLTLHCWAGGDWLKRVEFSSPRKSTESMLNMVRKKKLI